MKNIEIYVSQCSEVIIINIIKINIIHNDKKVNGKLVVEWMERISSPSTQLPISIFPT